MSVFVRSLIEKPNLKFWNHTKDIDIDFSFLQFDQNGFDQNVYEDSIYDKYYGLSNGILVHHKERKKIFLICPNISNRYSKTTTIYFNTRRNELTKLEVKKINSVPELDLSIFDVRYNNKLISYCYDINDIDYEISRRTNITIKNCNLTKDEDNKNILDYKEYEAEIENIIFNSLESNILTKIPIYNIDIKGLSEKTVLNGSAILNNNKIIGFVSDFGNNGNLYGIPSYCIRYIIDLVNENIDINLKTFIVKTQLASLQNDNEQYWSHYIEENYGIRNGRIIPRKSFIFKINGKTFNEDGMIYCDKLKYDLPLDTYVLLNNQYTSFTIDLISNNEKQTQTTLNTKPIDYKKYSTIPLKYNYKCIIIKGLVFVEANEEYLKSLRFIEYRGALKDVYNKKFSYSQNKSLILVDILFDKIHDDNIIDKYKEHNLPLINIEKSKYYIPIMKKIYSFNATNIENIYKQIGSFNFSPMPLHLIINNKNKESGNRKISDIRLKL